MAITIKLNVNIDLSKVMNIKRFEQKNQPLLLSTAAARYEQFLRNRFIRNSRGGGQWVSLAASTIKRKEQRGIADRPELILRESDLMLDSIGTKVVSGTTFVGFVRDRAHTRKIRLLRLVRIHTIGGPKLPSRKVVDYPDSNTRMKMVDDIKDQYNKQLRKNRRNK